MAPDIVDNANKAPDAIDLKDGKKDGHKRGRGGKRNKHKTRAQIYKEKKPRIDYAPLIKDNENLVKFYKQQPFFQDDQEFDRFMECLRESLPASFRINTFDMGQALFMRRFIQGPELNEFLAIDETQLESGDKESARESVEESAVIDEVIEDKKTSEQVADVWPMLEPLSWYPKQFGYQMNISRIIIRKSPILQRFHKFLMAETDNGFISRQEAVSMIPPLVLDVHRGQNVLDMCAAPGSKTAQLLEYLKNDIMSPDNSKPTPDKQTVASDDLFDDGMVVANDVDNKRCYMLVHQSSRLNSPNCIIINQDAARLPDMMTFANDGDNYSYLKFDRILCDVPCAGDGTIRKSPDVWKKWSVGNSNNFHGMQAKILRRGVELLKENGLLVYSTCSMNPIEDEAVVATILRASQGQVVLEDVASKLVGLKYKPGTSKWVVMSKDMKPIESYEHVVPEHSTHTYPSLFPPTEEESLKFNLHKCIRILPHLQNTGGFFVAVLRKLTTTLPWETPKEPNKTPKKATEQNNNGAGDDETTSQPLPPRQPPKPKKPKFGGFREAPFYFMDNEDPDWINIKNVYGLSDNFPTNQLSYRCQEGKKRSIYLMSKRTRSFIIANREEDDRKHFVKIINGGMRLFHRAQTEAGYRICQDGVKEILPYIRDDIKIPLSKDDLVALLKSRKVAFDALSSGQQIVDKIAVGSFIFIYKYNPGGHSTGGKGLEELPLVAWKGEVTVTLYVSNTYRTHLLALAQLNIGDDGGAVDKEKNKEEENVEQ